MKKKTELEKFKEKIKLYIKVYPNTPIDFTKGFTETMYIIPAKLLED